MIRHTKGASVPAFLSYSFLYSASSVSSFFTFNSAYTGIRGRGRGQGWGRVKGGIRGFGLALAFVTDYSVLRKGGGGEWL